MCGIFAHVSSGRLTDRQRQKLYSQFLSFSHRGPDHHTWEEFTLLLRPAGGIKQEAWTLILGFHRLEVVGDAEHGRQPYAQDGVYLICNGEIYNWKQIAASDQTSFSSDCQAILHLYLKGGIEAVHSQIQGVYSFVLVDTARGEVHTATDLFGVRPLYSCLDQSFTFASQGSALDLPHLHPGGTRTLIDLFDLSTQTARQTLPIDPELKAEPSQIRPLFERAVRARIEQTDRPVGFFLSGGLDSSLVLAVAATVYCQKRWRLPIPIFSIGLSGSDSPDLEAAVQVVEALRHKYPDLKFDHHLVHFTVEEGVAAIPEVIGHLGSSDQTTVRASVPMYLLSKYVAGQTQVRVLLSGEGSDEVFGGYLYFHYASNAAAHRQECRKLLEQLYLFDVRRVDRTTAAWGLEVRVPFLDRKLVTHCLSLSDPQRTPHLFGSPVDPRDRIEKALLRRQFSDLLPERWLWRQKEGMSDAVGYSWVDHLRAYAQSLYPEAEHPENEWYASLLPREEVGSQVSPLRAPLRGPLRWLPNPDWVQTWGEPSARVLDVHSRNKLQE